MIARGFDKPLYIQPFDHRGSFETGMFGWKGALTPEQTAQIAAAKQVIYDGFKGASSTRWCAIAPGSSSTKRSAPPSSAMPPPTACGR